MPRLSLRLVSLLGLVTACTAAEAPPLEPPAVGMIVGEVFRSDPDEGLVSVDGAVVQLYGTSNSVRTEAGRKFVLASVPVGEHTLSISHSDSGTARRLLVRVGAAFETVTLTAAQ